jgi:hypothetical protein
VDSSLDLYRPTSDRSRRRPGSERERPRRSSIRPPASRHIEHLGRPSARRTPRALDAVQELADRARHERSSRWLFSPDRAYFLGVETAAAQVLHPEVEALSTVAWFDAQHPAFVAGYLETVATLAPLWSWSAGPTLVPAPANAD